MFLPIFLFQAKDLTSLKSDKLGVESIMPRCKGVLISATTNTCRTLMAEGILRHMSGGLLPVVSGGLDYHLPISAHVDAVLGELGIHEAVGPSKGISKLMRTQGRTFDVLISFGSESAGSSHVEFGISENLSSSEAYLVNGESIPPHWPVVGDEGNTVRSWKVWSPRNPMIEHENSTRKFQDHLYRGEPLFSTRESLNFRSKLRLTKRWDIDPIEVLPMERPCEVIEKHRHTRDAIAIKCHELLSEMENHYGEKLIITPLS